MKKEIKEMSKMKEILWFVRMIADYKMYGSELTDLDDPGSDAMDAMNDLIETARDLLRGRPTP